METFSSHLINKGVITKEQHEAAMQIQNKARLLGKIAVDENFLTQEEVNEVVEFQEKNFNIKFGEAAVSLGYLTVNQYRYLLDIRTRIKVRIGDVLVQKGFITQEILHKELMDFDGGRRKIRKILICDPSSTIISILKNMLQKYGYYVFQALTGDDALSIASSEMPELLITSVELDRMDGYDLCFKMISNPATTNIKLIMISSDSKFENVEKAFKVGVNHFITKPIKENELINMLYQLEKEESKKREEKILIADDSSGARLIIHKELSINWNKIYMATNGKEAVEMAMEIKPDLITMDVEMPVMNGFEACKALKECADTENIPVVIISSSDSSKNRDLGFAAGAVEFFTKPFKSGSLSDFLRMLVETQFIQKKENVLLVDDSVTTCHILRYYFKKNGFNVFVAKNGIEALEMLDDCKPSIILTDCIMPEMDGFTFIKKVRMIPKYIKIPILILSAVNNKADIIKGLVCGANDYILKPFEETELFARINAHFRNIKLFEMVESEKQKLAKANMELEKANKDKDMILSMAAHDLRNPINSIIGFADMLCDEDEELDLTTIKESLKLILKSSNGMLELLNSILDLSRLQHDNVSLVKEPYDLYLIVCERVKMAKIVAKKKGIKINLHNSEPIELLLDAQKIEQVVDNFLSNAIKYSKKGPHILVNIKKTEKYATFIVKDSGVGIPKDEQEKIFTPFCKLSVLPTGGEKSTGLGLAICSNIIKAHNGQIGFKSEEGVGSTFYFSLPLEAKL